MLYEIEQPPSAAASAIQLHASDNVAIARVALPAAHRIEVGGLAIVTNVAIPAGHKVATRSIRVGEAVHRYGNVIGFATQPIEPGEHVHVHNLGYKELEAAEVLPNPVTKPVSRQTLGFPSGGHSGQRSFFGYKRTDGRVGTRNYIAVVAASNCAAYTAELIAKSFDQASLPDNIDGVVAFPHGEGCGMAIGPDTQQLQRTLMGVLDHPNVAGAIILGLGCEVNQIGHYLGTGDAPVSAPVTIQGLTLQESGGTTGALEMARKHIGQLIEQAAAERRQEVPASAIRLGLNCGGSDSFSGVTANPALGYCCDLIVEQGGSVVLAETTEIFGAEHLLVRRAVSAEVAQSLLAQVENYKAYLRQFGGSFNDNPSPGNKEGGLTNILEKSLGAVAKAGTSPLTDVLEYAERIRTSGFTFMNTPGYDPVSITGLAAGGVNLIAFTTGRGSAIGFPNVPVLKIASNTRMYQRMTGNMDINAGTISDGTATIEKVGQEIFDVLMRVASGERTKAELLGHHEFAPWRIGPVM